MLRHIARLGENMNFRGVFSLRTASCFCAVAVLLSQTACMIPVIDPSEMTEDERKRDQARARRDLGIDYLSKGQNAIALRELVFAVKANPDDPATQLWLGEGYRRQGHDDLALGAMTEAVRLEPTYQVAHNNLSAFYIQLEDYENAVKHAQVLIDDPLYGQPWKAFSNRGYAQMKLGRIAEARESLETATEFRKDFWPASLNLGLLERDAGNKLKAVKHFQRVIKHPVGHGPRAEASFHIAQILVSIGHREKAIKYFTASAQNDPDGRWADQSRDYLKILR
jgi:type IV pilus biogenesis/stability protein PilW